MSERDATQNNGPFPHEWIECECIICPYCGKKNGDTSVDWNARNRTTGYTDLRRV